jgi:Na+/phosphate symporter
MTEVEVFRYQMITEIENTCRKLQLERKNAEELQKKIDEISFEIQRYFTTVDCEKISSDEIEENLNSDL